MCPTAVVWDEAVIITKTFAGSNKSHKSWDESNKRLEKWYEKKQLEKQLIRLIGKRPVT